MLYLLYQTVYRWQYDIVFVKLACLELHLKLINRFKLIGYVICVVYITQTCLAFVICRLVCIVFCLF
jgi:hypothetical protein